MQKLTVSIYTYNEEENIEECVNSAKQLTDTILVIDTGSTDKTVEIAKKNGASVIQVDHHDYVEPIRHFGITHADSEWIFILDADERISAELADEVEKAINSDTYTFYKIARKELFAKTVWLKHGGWWPNYQLRLLKKEAFVAWPTDIHSTPDIKGNHGLISKPLIHYSKNDYAKIVNKTAVFEDLESGLLHLGNRNATTITFFRKFLGELYRRLLKNMGFLDGTIGIIESIYQAFSKTITYLYLYEKKNRSL